jgi:membrane protease YdiL (CAAX protease family)
VNAAKMRPPRWLSYLLIACGYSWILWFAAIASQRGWIPFRFTPGPVGSFGPAIAAFLVIGSRDRRVALLKSLVTYRGAKAWLLLAALVPVAITLVAIGAHATFVGALPRPILAPLVWTPVVTLLILVLGGPLGEEPGWRGLAVPEIAARHGFLQTSLAVAAMWFVWHLPLFWLGGAAQQGSSIALFTATLCGLSVLFTRLYLATAPSLVPCLVLHTSVNVTSFGVPYILPGVADSRAYNIAFLMSVLVAAVAATLTAARPSLTRGDA